MMDYLSQFADPFRDAWTLYQGLGPDQQRSVLLLAAVGVVVLIGWVAYQVYGERAVIVLPAGMLRYSLLLLVLPFVLIGAVAGRGTSVPSFLRRSWTAEPDPERAQIPVETVDPMRLPGSTWKLSTRVRTRQIDHAPENRRQNQ